MAKNIGDSSEKSRELTLTLARKTKDLIEANKAKDAFLANMSHELKTPLNSINVISSIMKKNKDNLFDEKTISNLSIINKCGNDLLFLINDVLSISKLEAGEIIVENRTINLESTVKDIKLMFDPQMKEKNLTFNYSFDKSIEYIYSDQQKIEQIIKNLLSNALKFANNGIINFTVINVNNLVHISVQDNGIGIDKDKLEHVFDRFKQADDSTTRNYGGTGLGLSICKELAELLEGDIDVISELDKGSTFTLKIPKNLEKVQVPKLDNSIVPDKKDNTILLFSNDVIELMPLAISLKEFFEVQQVFKVDEFKAALGKSFSAIIINYSKNDTTQINDILHTTKNKIIYQGRYHH
jgi:signal transduction histidine kinase